MSNRTPLQTADTESLASRGADGTAEPATSPELTGGAGFTFEAGVAATYLAALLAESTAPGLAGRTVTRVLLQRGSLGHPMDDVVVEGQGTDGNSFRLDLQVKRSLVISSAQTNVDFRDIVLRAWTSIGAPSFQHGVDRVGAVIGTIANASRRDFETLCEWARFDASADGLAQKLAVPGVAGHKAHQFEDVKRILSEAVPAHQLPAAAHRLLSHFVLVRHDMLGEGSADESAGIARLADILDPSQRTRGADLWQFLLGIARLGAANAANLDRKTLVARLAGSFRVKGAPSLLERLAIVNAESRRAVAEIATDVAGFTIDRPVRVAAVREALVAHRFVQIGGLPGSGKSAVLRSLVVDALATGSALFLKGDRLAGSTWAQYAAKTGLGSTGLEELLVEIEASGVAILFVDGLDRVERQHRGVVCDLFNALISSDLLSRWQVVATVRDTGIEPVRVWLPKGLMKAGTPIVDVGAFDDEEASALAEQVPSLAPLLLGEESVKAIVRRPFFAAVMARDTAADALVPRSEIELAGAWWARGGYAAEADSALRRQLTLVQLAKAGAMSLGRRIALESLDAATVTELQADSIIRQVRAGHTARFVHDIYFEWAFLQLLVARGDQWLEAVREVGEPPVLGRVVELLSQIEITEGDAWQRQLEQLERRGDVRPQWLRAWMVGPIGLPSFRSYESVFEAALLEERGRRVARLAVWVQAEKTKPNANLLDGRVLPHLALPERIRFADLMACPSDYQAWRRLCHWLLRRMDTIHRQWWPDVFTVFEVWQNAAADFANPLSERIVSASSAWLMDIERRYHSSHWPRDLGLWDQLDDDAVKEFESRLRSLVLRAARAYPLSVREYLHHLREPGRQPRGAFGEVMSFAPILSEVCATELVDYCLQTMKRSLPVDNWRRPTGSMFGHAVHSQEWHSLSIADEHQFFPSAPTREPFASLFRQAPLEARRLVRELANHATRAWRQLHRLDSRERGTPVPMTLEFPWGPQTFWGGAQQYLWSRGIWGSHAVGSGLMALELWAFTEIDAGRPVDEVLHALLDGHTGCGVLGAAAAVAMESMHRSNTSLPILTCQRLWHWDIQRLVSNSSSTSGLIGFDRADVHYEAVVASNKRRCRKNDVRGLASAMVLQGGDIGRRAAAAIIAFAGELPVDYAEARSDLATVEQLGRTSEVWAEVGRRENYRAAVTEDGSAVMIEHENPRARGPDFDAIQQRSTTMAEHSALLLWAEECFDKLSLSPRMSVDEAVARARGLDADDLFDEGYSQVDDRHQRQAAVAGVAAAVLRLRLSVDADVEMWAADVCLSAWTTPEAPSDFFVREAVLLFHPVLYAVKGLTGLLLHRPEIDHDAVSALIHASAHPYDRIAAEALGGLVSLWDCQPWLGWLGLQLTCQLSLVQRPRFDSTRDERAATEQRHVEGCLQRALSSAAAMGGMNASLPAMPPAWVPAADGRQRVQTHRGRSIVVEWEHPETDLDWALLTKVLHAFPVAAALNDSDRRAPFLAWCEELARWTIDRLSPSWSAQPGQIPFEVEGSELFEWRRELFQFLAKVSLHLEPSESFRRFVSPAVATPDDVFASLAQPLVWLLACSIMDESTFPERPLELLGLVIPRLLRHRAWSESRREDGSVHDADLARIVRSLFFIDVEKALGAARFANGNWQEVSRALPLVAPILLAEGKNLTVANAYASMCERSFGSFPFDEFVAHIPMIVGNRVGLPAGWRGSSLPARLADLIQRFSEAIEPLPDGHARTLLRALDSLVDMGDRRAAAVQYSEAFKDVRLG